MGAERRLVFDLINVVQGTAKLPQALIRDKRLETLYLLPASQTRDKDALTEEGVELLDRGARPDEGSGCGVAAVAAGDGGFSGDRGRAWHCRR
jgi:hypothetical protein